jgi:hypothetical protein
MKRTTTLLALAAVTAALAPAAADAKSSDKIVRGSCGSAAMKLKASPENGKIEIEFEVDSNRNGQSWKVKLHQNGNLIYSKTKVTKAPSGSFTSRKVTANAAGTDVISARATSPAGKVCTLTLNY